jgi:protoheme IX farnesyltransferase
MATNRIGFKLDYVTLLKSRDRWTRSPRAMKSTVLLSTAVRPCNCRPFSTLKRSLSTTFFFDNRHPTSHQPRFGIPGANTLQPISHTVSVPQPTLFKHAEPLTSGRIFKVYAQLSKPRLSALNVLTAMSGFALCPLPTTIPILLSTTIGTALCAASANALNQLQEIPFDAQMARTRGRPLVRNAITPVHAAGFAFVAGVGGTTILWTLVNHTTAMLGFANIALYTGLYTWLKRKSVLNTWVGAVVGAVPPLMGWAACGGNILPSLSHPVQFFLPQFLHVSHLPVDLTMIDNPLAPLALFLLLFSWQFPHFNPLSYLLRDSYAQAGYRMLSVLSPKRNALVAFRHAIFLVPICSVLVPISGLTTWAFALTSLIPNAICVRAAWKFWRNGGEKEARIMFQHSLWYLPVILGLMMVHKQDVSWLEWMGLRRDRSDLQTSPAGAK